MNAQTIHILEAEYNAGTDPSDFEPLPLQDASIDHCDCGSIGCHYHCDPVTCMQAAWEAYFEATVDWDGDCDTCNGPCTL
jgi:hypothetical protein